MVPGLAASCLWTQRRGAAQHVHELESHHKGCTPSRAAYRATDWGLWQTRDRHPVLGMRPPRVHPWEEQAQLPSASRGRITPNKTTRALTRAAMSLYLTASPRRPAVSTPPSLPLWRGGTRSRTDVRHLPETPQLHRRPRARCRRRWGKGSAETTALSPDQKPHNSFEARGPAFERRWGKGRGRDAHLVHLGPSRTC